MEPLGGRGRGEEVREEAEEEGGTAAAHGDASSVLTERLGASGCAAQHTSLGGRYSGTASH